MKSELRQREFSVVNLFLNNKAIIILVLLCVISSFISPAFLDGTNLLNVARQIAPSAVIGIGFTCVIASGNLDLSVGFMVGMLGVIMGLVSKTGMPFWLVLVIGLAFGAACGFINGFVGMFFNLPLFIVTLATGQVFRGACQLLSNTSPISGLPSEFKFFGQAYFLGIPIPLYILLLVAITVYIVLNRTSFGRYAVATGGNRKAARTSGINVNVITVGVYMIMGVCAAIGAIIMTGRAASAQPAAGQGMEMDAIAAVVIGGTPLSGGKGKVLGTVFGCLIVGVINNALNLGGVNTNWQLIAKGMLILIAVLLDVLSSRYFDKKLKNA